MRFPAILPPVWGRPQEFPKGFAGRQQNLRLRPTRGLRGPVGWWIAKFRVFLGQSALVRFSEHKTSDSAPSRGVMTEISWSRRIRIKIEHNMYRHRNSLACPFLRYSRKPQAREFRCWRQPREHGAPTPTSFPGGPPVSKKIIRP